MNSIDKIEDFILIYQKKKPIYNYFVLFKLYQFKIFSLSEPTDYCTKED